MEGDEANAKRKQISCALEVCNPINIVDSLQSMRNNGFNYMITNIMHPWHARDLTENDPPTQIGRTDRILTTQDWTKLIVGTLPKYDVDNEILHIRESEKLLMQQVLGYATHLALPAVLLPLTQRHNRNLAHIFANKYQSGSNFQLWIELPMVLSQSPLIEAETIGSDCPWEIWNDFRHLLDFNKRIGLALKMPNVTNMPSMLQLDRWMGEPIQSIILQTSQFIVNSHNQPVLPSALQDIIKRFLPIDVHFILRGSSGRFSYKQYHDYVNYLGKKLYGPTIMQDFQVGCEDYLQTPLQPLAEQLESLIYEVFEKDPVKYVLYQDAILRALREYDSSVENVVIMVVGAGRGPLVQAVLNASHITKRKVRVYAVEKNPYAINALEDRISNEWKDCVTLIRQDMRVCRPPEDADILVSELLGSFGDNELSPECLDGAQSFLKPQGISIPESYTSYLAPIHSPKLYTEVVALRKPDKSLMSVFEKAYVVQFVNAYIISASKRLFTFTHPNRASRINNERMATLRFSPLQNCLLCGFAGYFETVLYKDIVLSINPQTATANMVSWFPIFFPIATPIQIKENNVIEVTFWRAANADKVWYEWCLNSPQPSSIYNPNGCSYFMKK